MGRSCARGDASILKRATVGVYRQECKAVVRHLCAQRGSSALEEAEDIARIDRALQKRIGTPGAACTASRKANDPTEREVRMVFARILTCVREQGDVRRHLALGATMFFLARFGCRTIELSRAEIGRGHLVLRNAKYGNGRAGSELRAIRLDFLSRTERRALPIARHLLRGTIALYRIHEGEGALPAYQRWHAAAAELLARCCSAAGVRRLHLYSFRHVAIATWRPAGLTPVQIAALAGHASVVTATRHYGRGSSAWRIGALPAADPTFVAAPILRQPRPDRLPLRRNRSTLSRRPRPGRSMRSRPRPPGRRRRGRGRNRVPATLRHGVTPFRNRETGSSTPSLPGVGAAMRP